MINKAHIQRSPPRKVTRNVQRERDGNFPSPTSQPKCPGWLGLCWGQSWEVGTKLSFPLPGSRHPTAGAITTASVCTGGCQSQELEPGSKPGILIGIVHIRTPRLNACSFGQVFLKFLKEMCLVKGEQVLLAELTFSYPNQPSHPHNPSDTGMLQTVHGNIIEAKFVLMQKLQKPRQKSIMDSKQFAIWRLHRCTLRALSLIRCPCTGLLCFFFFFLFFFFHLNYNLFLCKHGDKLTGMSPC